MGELVDDRTGLLGLASAARELGQRDGHVLADRKAGLEAVFGVTRIALNQLVTKKKAEASEAVGNATALSSKLQAATLRAARHYADLEKLRSERDQSPADFSLVKGLMYVGLAIILLIADMAILGEVFGSVLKKSFYDANGTSFVTNLLTHPILAFNQNPGLLLLMVAVLVMGMALKLARDHFRPSRGRSRALAVTENVTIMAFLAASLLILAIVALVRFYKPLGGTGTDSPNTVGAIQWFSGLLGLLLPFISAVYFIKGYEQIANRFRLILAWMVDVISQTRIERRTRSVAVSSALVERNQLELEFLEQATALDNVIGQVKAAYRLGYAEGFLKLIYDSPSILEVTRTRLMAQQVAEVL